MNDEILSKVVESIKKHEGCNPEECGSVRLLAFWRHGWAKGYDRADRDTAQWLEARLVRHLVDGSRTLAVEVAEIIEACVQEGDEMPAAAAALLAAERSK